MNVWLKTFFLALHACGVVIFVGEIAVCVGYHSWLALVPATGLIFSVSWIVALRGA